MKKYGLFGLHSFEETRHVQKLIVSTPYFYGTKERDDYLLRDPSTYPRYAYLAQMALIHYAGRAYNPVTVSEHLEITIRSFIKGIIEYKVIFRTGGYDWDWIDNFFRKYVNVYFDLDIPYDDTIFADKSRWKYRAAYDVDIDRPV